MRHPAEDVADYFAAVQWLRTAWTTLPVPPARLHTRDIDGQLGQRYSAPFAKVLNGLGGWRSIPVQDICYHPTLPRDKYGEVGSPFDCGDCQGTGLHIVNSKGHQDRYGSDHTFTDPLDVTLHLKEWVGQLSRKRRTQVVEEDVED